MTRAAVMEGFEMFFGAAIEETVAEFSPSRAVSNGVRGPGGAFVDTLLENSGALRENIIKPELEYYRDQTVEQFELVLEYAAADEPFDAFRAEILAADVFTEDLRPDLPDERREAVEAALLDRHRAFADATKPLLESAESSFWDAATATLTREEAKRLVEEHFAFTKPMREHREAFLMETTFDVSDVVGGLGLLVGNPSLTVEFTDEAFRAMEHAEETVIADAKKQVEERFGDSSDAADA